MENSSAFPFVRFSKTHCLSLGCLAQQGYWSDLRADTDALFFPNKIQTHHSQTTLAQGREFVLCQRGCWWRLADRWCEGRFRSRVTDADWPQMLDDVEEPMPARPTTLKDPGTLDQIVLDQHSLTLFPSQPWCKMCVEPRGGDSPHREQSKIDAVVPQLQIDCGHMEMEALFRLRVSSWEETPLLEPYTRWCQIPRRWTYPYVVAGTAKWVRDLVYSQHTENERDDQMIRSSCDTWMTWWARDQKNI